MSLTQIVNQETRTDSFIIIVTFSCCCLSAIFAIFGNLMIIWIIASVKSMRSPTNIFIANLAVSDILIGTLVIPFQFQTTLLRRWVLPWFMCYMCPTIQVITVSNSVFTLTAIALERYRAVIYPLLAHISKMNAKVEILVIWIFSIILSIPTIVALKVELIWDEIKEEKTMPFCANKGLTTDIYGAYNSALVCIQYFIPLCIISYTYIRMALVLNKQEETGEDSFSIFTTIYSIQIRRKKKKVIKMLFIVVFLFTLSWLPLQLFNITKQIWPQIQDFRYLDVIRFTCNWLALSNSCYNPYIYVIYNEKFNKEFRKRFKIIYCLCCSTREKIQTNSISSINYNNPQNKHKSLFE